MAVHLVTGVAGFIGSQLAEALIEAGEIVRGVDCFTPYYPRAVKESNLATLRSSDRFTFHEVDLRTSPLDDLLEEVDVVDHQASQPGVRSSWSEEFRSYSDCNVLATQRLLEAARRADIGRFVYASSSSVYGDAQRFPVVEDDLPRPRNPYGVTKLAAEHLCSLYATNHDMRTVSLRYFTVYGPRQRPDMAIHRLIRAALTGQPFSLYGDDSTARDFTHVDDVVRASVAATAADLEPGAVLNVCAGGSTTMRQLIGAVEHATGSTVDVRRHASQRGDVKRTMGSNELATSQLGWHAEVDVAEGIRSQVEWQRSFEE